MVSRSEDLVLDQDEEGHVEVDWPTEFPDSGGYTAYASSGDDVVSMDFTVTPVEPELVDVSHSPDVAALETPEGREDVTVELEVRYATSVDLGWEHWDVNDDELITRTGEEVVNPGGMEVWTAEIEIENPGQFPVLTEYSAFIENRDPETEAKTLASDDRSYRTFKHVEDIAVVYAKFADSEPDTGLWPEHTTESELQEHQQHKRHEINEYMASWKGSWGGLGFDFTFYDNDGEWHTVPENAEYYEEESLNLGSFVGDAEDSADVDSFEYTSQIGVSPGDVGEYPFEVDDFSGATWFGSDRIHVNEISTDYPSWIHELGHVIGHLDLYGTHDEIEDWDHRVTDGHVGFTGIMGSGTRIEPAAPFTAVSRTTLHEFHNIGFDREDAEHWPWASQRTSSGYGIVLPLTSLEGMEYQDSVEVYRPPLLDRTSDVDYVFGARGVDRPVDGPIDTLERGVYIYDVEQVVEDGSTTQRITLLEPPSWFDWISDSRPDGPTLESDGESIEIPTSDAGAEFVLDDSGGFGAYYSPTVEVTDAEVSSTTVLSMRNKSTSDDIDTSDGSLSEPPEDLVHPRLYLRGVDEEGNVVGPDGELDEYLLEVPGVEEENVHDQLGLKWMKIPDDAVVNFELETEGLSEWYDWLESEGHASLDEEEDRSVDVDLMFDVYGSDAEFNESQDEVPDTVTVTRSVSVSPDEPASVAALAYVDFEPDTYNLNSGGRWVNVSLNTANGDVDVRDVDLESVRLNEEVEPITDTKYGFVQDPVENDVLNMKFPRDDVSTVLDVGANASVFVTAETTEDELIVGSDETRVIERPDGGQPPADPPGGMCPPDEGPMGEIPGEGPDEDGPGERIGPPDEAPGEGPSDCPPDRDEDSKPPGEGDESDDTTPGDRGGQPGEGDSSDKSPPGDSGGQPDTGNDSPGENQGNPAESKGGSGR